MFLFAACVAALGCGQAQEGYWIRQLNEGSPAERMRAARALGTLRSVRAVGPLARAARRAITDAVRASTASGSSFFFTDDVEEAKVCYEAIVAVGQEAALPELLRIIVKADTNRDMEALRAARGALEETIRGEFPLPWQWPECVCMYHGIDSLFLGLDVLRRDPACDPATKQRADAAYASILRRVPEAQELDEVRMWRKRAVLCVASVLGIGRKHGYQEGISDPCTRRDRTNAPRLAWATPTCGESLTEGGDPIAVALDREKLVLVGHGYDDAFRDGYLVVAYSSDGSKLWSAWDEVRPITCEGHSNRATAVAMDGYGKVCVTGRSWREDAGMAYATQKYSPDGRRLWMALSGEDRHLSERASLAVDGTGAVCVSGSSGSDGVDRPQRYLTVKYSPEGEELWRAYWAPAGSEISEAQAIAVGQDGAVCVTGSCWWRWETGMDICTVKYSPEGKELWWAVYGGPGRGPDVPNAIAVDGAGSVYVAGFSWGGATDFDSVVVKYSAEGIELWAARYDGPASGWDAVAAIAVDPAGGVYVAGYSFGGGTGDDYLTIKYSSDGRELWAARYDGPGGAEDEAGYVALDAEGGVYVGGRSSIADLGAEYCVVKYSSEGEEVWVAPYRCWTLQGAAAGGAHYAALAGMGVDGHGGVYVVGSRRGAAPPGCILVVKYAEGP